jgi:glucokinase
MNADEESTATERPSKSDQQRVVIALDLGGTKLASCLFVGEGPPQQRRVTPLEQREGRAVGELITGEVRRLREAAVQLGTTVEAVGISVPGIADARTGRVWAPNIPGWDDYPLQAEVQAAVADANVRVVVDSDRAAYILGEAWQGAARGCRDAVFLAVGTGIGAGIIADGRVLHGAHGIAGAIGWMALDRPFKPEYKAYGCFETFASGEGLAKQSRMASAQELFVAYENGDKVATDVLVLAIEYWGMAAANLVSLFNPEKIILGGGVFGPATRFLDAIAEEARRWAQPISMGRVTFEASKLGGDAGLYGAGHLALFGSQLASERE